MRRKNSVDLFLKIAIKTLIKNKKRAIATLIGVVVSVALITGIFLISTTVKKVVDNNRQNHYEQWAIGIKGKNELPSDHHINVLKKFKYVGEHNENVKIVDINDDVYDMLDIYIEEGRNAISKEEVVVTREFWNSLKGNKNFEETKEIYIDGIKNPIKIVGIVSNLEFRLFVGSENVIVFNNVYKGDKIQLYNIIDYYRNIDYIKSLEKDKIIYNEVIIDEYNQNEYYGNERLNILTIALLLLISSGSFTLMYNTFSIALRERRKAYSILESIGASERQKRRVQLYESTFFSLLGIPIGIFIGSYVAKKAIAYFGDEVGEIFFQNIDIVLDDGTLKGLYIVSAIVSLIIIQLASILPEYRLKKDSIASNISINSNDSRIRKRLLLDELINNLKVKNKLIMRNLQLNKRHFKVTTLSIIIPVVVLIFGNALLIYANNSLDNFFIKSNKFDIEFQNINYDKKAKEIYKRLSNIDGVQGSSYNAKLKVDTYINDNVIPYYLNIIDDNSFITYAKKINIDNEYDITEMDAIGISYTLGYDGVKDEIAKNNIFSKKNSPSSITIKNNNKNSKINIDKYTDILPDGVSNDIGAPVIIMSESKADKIFENFENLTFDYEGILFKTKNPTKIIENIKNVAIDEDYYIDNIENIYSLRKDIDSIIFMVKVFLYTFISLLGIVSLVNAFNTISSNVTVRKKQFISLLSIGMTDDEICRIVFWENILLGIRAVVYGIVVSMIALLLPYHIIEISTFTGYVIPIGSILSSIVGVLVGILIINVYTINRMKKRMFLSISGQLRD